MRRHYVYYRVPAARLAEVTLAVRSLQTRHPGELLRRPGADDGLVTLMEVYGPVDDTLAAAIEAEALVALVPWLHGERHVETFETLD